MPELLTPADTSLPPSSPRTSTSKASPAISLAKIESDPDERFLGYDATTAGRAVIIELYAPKGATADQKRATWKYYQHVTNLAALGVAAKSLELAGYNWRQAKDFEQVIAQAALLRPVATN